MRQMNKYLFECAFESEGLWLPELLESSLYSLMVFYLFNSRGSKFESMGIEVIQLNFNILDMNSSLF